MKFAERQKKLNEECMADDRTLLHENSNTPVLNRCAKSWHWQGGTDMLDDVLNIFNEWIDDNTYTDDLTVIVSKIIKLKEKLQELKA